METSLNTTNNGTTPNKSKLESPILQERKDYAAELMKNHNGHVPVVIEKHKKSTLNMANGKKIVLVYSGLKVMNFMEFIRRHVKLHSSSGLFLFVNGNHLVRTGDLLGELYMKYANADTFLYITISDKEIWG